MSGSLFAPDTAVTQNNAQQQQQQSEAPKLDLNQLVLNGLDETLAQIAERNPSRNENTQALNLAARVCNENHTFAAANFLNQLSSGFIGEVKHAKEQTRQDLDTLAKKRGGGGGHGSQQCKIGNETYLASVNPMVLDVSSQRKKTT